MTQLEYNLMQIQEEIMEKKAAKIFNFASGIVPQNPILPIIPKRVGPITMSYLSRLGQQIRGI
jgi:hypothetical protein